MALSMNELTTALHWRYAVKKYDPDGPLTLAEITCLKEAIRLAPSSFGLQPYRAIFIEDARLRSLLRSASYDQPQVSEASRLVVFAVETTIDESYVHRHFEHAARIQQLPLSGDGGTRRAAVIRAIQRMSEDTKRSWATHQAYLALGFLLFAAAQLGIDANPMEGFIPARYDEILGLSERGLSAVVIAALGRRSPDDRSQYVQKVRRPVDELILDASFSARAQESL